MSSPIEWAEAVERKMGRKLSDEERVWIERSALCSGGCGVNDDEVELLIHDLTYAGAGFVTEEDII